MSPSRTRVIVLYGGKSAEHEVSCRSAAFVFRHLDPEKFDIVGIGISKTGQWFLQDSRVLAQVAKTPGATMPISTAPQLKSLNSGLGPSATFLAAAGESQLATATVVFPVLHGPLGEDGTVQGFFELAGVAYVGSGTLGSAVGMDKVVAKKLAAAAGVPVVPSLTIRRGHWDQKNLQAEFLQKVGCELAFPVFVKPVCQGSSVGVSKVKTASDLAKACVGAFAFDDRILVEKGLNVREIECAVLGTDDPQVSVPGEIVPHGEFYSYEAKYLDAAAASIEVPAKLDEAQVRVAQDLSRRVFLGLELAGMARVDLFLEKETGKFYFNEVNTIPGFTEISQYPMLWQASGVGPGELIDRLVDDALGRWRRKAALVTEVFDV